MRCAGAILVPSMRWFSYPSPLPFQQPISESPPPAPLVTTLSESRRFFRSGPVGAHLEAAYAGRRQEPVLPEETWPNSLCRGRYHRYPFSGPALTAAQPSFLPVSRSRNPPSFSRLGRGGPLPRLPKVERSQSLRVAAAIRKAGAARSTSSDP